MSGSMGDPRTKKSIGWNYIGAHNNLFSAVWNQAPGGFHVSQQPNDPSAPFRLTPTIGTGGYGLFGQLLQHASAGALYQNVNCDGYWTNCYTNQHITAEHCVFQDAVQQGEGYQASEYSRSQDEVEQVEGYEAGEDSGSESETGDENGSEDDPFPSAFKGGFADADFVATVRDAIPLKKFHDRCFARDYDDDRGGSGDSTFFEDEDEVDILEPGKDDFTKMADAEAGSTAVQNDKDQFDCSPGSGDDTSEFQSGEPNVGVEGTDLTSESGSPCLLGDCGCAEHEIAQEISSTYTESQKAGYKKRNKTNDGPDCRKPRDMGAVEIAMRLAGQRKTEHIFEPVLGMVFDSKEEAYEFYNMYSWEFGFGIVKGRCVRRQKDPEYRSMQELCCERSGSDPRVIGSTKKINCRARIKMLRDNDGGWYVSEFVKQHNHPSAESCSEKRDWFSHKRLDPYTLSIIKYLRESNVNPTQVRCIVGRMFGSLKGAPCTKRTIRSVCSQIAREQMDDDVAKTLEVFKQMKQNDPDFQWSVQTDQDSRINTLMWCSGKSREQYACFGDVITFDTTYCTNFYKMPFGLFVGVNNHFQTVVFGGVLMRSETTESFEWVFKEFIQLMGGKPPKTVLTDQCKAMTIALGRVWPDTFHLWCKWHVLKKIRECLGPTYTKNAAFREEFYSIINEMMTKEEFDKSWDDLCSRYKLKDNPFMIRTFQCRSKWAKPWAKGNFCAGMTSTQRSESANWMLKRFVPRNSSMNHFVSQFNLLLEDRDMEEGREENMTKQLFVKYSRLWPIERHAIKIYTRQSLNLFRKQVDMAANFKVSAKGSGFYIIERNREERYPEWRKKTFKVHVYDAGARFFCECGYFEHVGILCCHTIRLMIRYEVKQIPEFHILTRWTRNAKDVVPEHMRFSAAKDDQTGSLSIWHRRLNSKALEACTKGNTYRETYDIVMKHLSSAIKEADEYIEKRRKSEQATETDTDEVEIVTDVESARGNRYGASGSSVGLSDSEILKLRGPVMDRGPGRPVGKRLLSSAEKGSRRTTKRRKTTTVDFTNAAKKSTKKQKKKQTASVDDGSMWGEHRGLPYQTTFCTKCRKPGHGRDRCAAQLNASKDSNGKYRCEKCGLKGHSEIECLVVDEDSNGYFR